MRLDELTAVEDPLERATAAERASKRAMDYTRACDRIRDDAFRATHDEGHGLSYQAIADAVGVSKSLVAGACKRG